MYQVYRIFEGEEQLLAETTTQEEHAAELLFWFTERPFDNIFGREV